MSTKTQAINTMCKICLYDEIGGAGTWRAQIEACTAPKCPLYEHRPVTEATQEKRKQEKISLMSPEELAKYRKKQADAKERFAK